MTAPLLREIAVPERPGEAPQALPGDVLIATGSGFDSAADAKSAVLIGVGPLAVAAPILEWTSERIRFQLPGGLGDPGPKEVRIRTKQGTSNPGSVVLEGTPSLPAAPVAMLPLGLQTRFSADGRELWVRAIPDTIHVDQHDPRLTAEEAELGRRYRDSGAGRGDVWLDLTTRFGAPRAEWIVRATLSGAVTLRDQLWARPARTRLLPRRLYAFAYDDSALLVSGYGRPIPFELPIGPEPGGPADTDPASDAGMAWMVDFSQALARGMALKLTLPDPPPPRIARLVVVGVETALTAEEGARELGDALAAHRYTHSVGFLPEGTPTNLTPEAPTDAADPTASRPPDAPSPLVPTSNADAAAWALGLSSRGAELFGDTPHAGEGGSLRVARAHLNAALWPATWGYFLEHMMAPVVAPTDLEPVRQHFMKWVRGCGPQPVLRIGEQPYGLLPALHLGTWAPADEGPALVKLASFLEGVVRPIWRSSLARVPRVSDEPPPVDPTDPQENPLLTVLSMQPTSISYRGRSVLGMPFVEAAWRFIRNTFTSETQLLSKEWLADQAATARAVLVNHGRGDWSPYVEKTVFGANYFPVQLPLVQRAGDPAQPLVTDWLTMLYTSGWQVLRADGFQIAERPLLYLLLRHSLLVSYLFAAGEMEPARPWRGGEVVVYGVDEIEDILDAPRPDMAWDLLTAPSAAGPAKGEVLDASPPPQLGDVREGIGQLIGLPVGVLEHAAAETLDLCSHRLDAWIGSFAQRRLNAIRGPGGAGGLHVGAYGFVEDLKRGDGSGSVGYVHTPSPAHASAAAILASGYRSHPDGLGARRPFGIDLSSERVRVALSMLEGVRSGKLLGALLGYRFERSLQERGLARFIDEFRHIAPLPLSGTAVASGATDPVGALNVADALELHRRWVAAKRSWPAGWPGGAAADELQAVLEELDDVVDALGDILLTEGVYQLAQGNAERAAAALRAAAQPTAAPPELEVIHTPHSGAAVTHRLAVLLPGNVAPATGWLPDLALARRAATEPRLDAWAGQLLGDPKRVHYRVRWEDPATGALLAEEERRLNLLVPAPSPLDIVYASSANEQSQLSELEQRIVYHAVRTPPAGVPMGARVRVIGSREPEIEQKIGLLELMELAQAVRELFDGARSIRPDDLSLPESPGSAAVDAAEMEARAAGAGAALQAAYGALGAALSGTQAEPLRAALLQASALGVPGAIPLAAVGDSPEALADLQAQAKVAQAVVRRRIDQLQAIAPAPPGDPRARADRAVACIQAVFGGSLLAVALHSAPPQGDRAQVDVSFRTSAALRGNDAFVVARWFQRLTRIREGAQRLGDVLLYADALGAKDTLRFEVAQLPVISGDRWLGLPFAGGSPPKGRVSVVAHLPSGPLDPARALAGLMLEHYTEVLPSPTKATGLAFHYDQPNAAAPQAIVLAVPSRAEENWTLEMLEAVAREALELAKLRMVDLDALLEAGHFVPATYLAFNAKGVTAATDFLAGRGEPLG